MLATMSAFQEKWLEIKHQGMAKCENEEQEVEREMYC